jgi:site-specific recombinase XerD
MSYYEDEYYDDPYISYEERVMTTIADLLPEFIDHLRDERQLARNSIKSYVSDLQQINGMVGGKPFSEVAIVDLRGLVADWKNDGLTGATIRRKLHALSTFYAFQMLMERVDKNLALIVQRVAPRRKRKVLKTLLTVSQWRKFIETEEPRRRNRVAWQLLAWLGMRNGEIRGIRVRDVNLETMTIIVSAGKGGNERELPLPDDADFLSDIVGQMEGKEPSDYLLNGDIKPHWSRHSFTTQFNNHIERCGLPDDITSHWLRHTVATYMSDEVTTFELRQWLGHKSTRTTELYVHNSQDSMQRAMDAHPLNNRSKG